MRCLNIQFLCKLRFLLKYYYCSAMLMTFLRGQFWFRVSETRVLRRYLSLLLRRGSKSTLEHCAYQGTS